MRRHTCVNLTGFDPEFSGQQITNTQIGCANSTQLMELPTVCQRCKLCGLDASNILQAKVPCLPWLVEGRLPAQAGQNWGCIVSQLGHCRPRETWHSSCTSGKLKNMPTLEWFSSAMWCRIEGTVTSCCAHLDCTAETACPDYNVQQPTINVSTITLHNNK